jgi:rare lipoprotein A
LVPVIPGRDPAIPRTWFEEGVASWYGPNFVGRPTANGEIFDPSELTAAHKFLPFDTRVLVTDLASGRSVVVRINDRGPFVGDRIIDLSRAAAESIDMIGSGTARVRLQVAPLASGEHPVWVDERLSGYDAIVPGMREGDLVVATGADGRRTVLRSVAVEPPTAVGLDGQEVWVAPALAERFGASVYIELEGIPLGGEQADAGN